jgi:hypothetical protein
VDASRIEPCAGTLISHDDGAVECTDPGCAVADPARHGLYLDCAEIHGGCECTESKCTEPEFVELAVAS